jgi:hypothetical protein
VGQSGSLRWRKRLRPIEDEDDDEHEDEDPNFGVWVKSSQEVRSNPRASARERFEKKLCSAANAKFHRRSQESELRSQESGVAEYASKVFIRKSGTGICPGKSPPESQIF